MQHRGGTALCQSFQVYEPTKRLPTQTHRVTGPVPSHKPVWTLFCGWADAVQQIREGGSLKAPALWLSGSYAAPARLFLSVLGYSFYSLTPQLVLSTTWI